LVTPYAFEFFSRHVKQKELPAALIDRMQQTNVLDLLFTFVQDACKKGNEISVIWKRQKSKAQGLFVL